MIGTKYSGATFITPNVKELSEYIGRNLPNTDEAIVEAAKETLDAVDFDYVVATRSAKGITIVSRQGQIWHNPATQQDVFDVSGAGDTVVAMIITAMAAGLTVRGTLHVANAAAGVVVSKSRNLSDSSAGTLGFGGLPFVNANARRIRLSVTVGEEMAAKIRSVAE